MGGGIVISSPNLRTVVAVFVQNQVGKLKIAAMVLRKAQVLAMTRTRAPLMVRVVKSGVGLSENK